MRVIGGHWRGRRLQAPKGQGVRPTTDRVKEAIFNIVGSEVRQAVAVDLCCGAGGLGVEALSRGASSAWFVDRDRRALASVRANLEACGAAVERWRLECAEAVAWLRTANVLENDDPWLLLADPPYGSGTTTALARALGELPVENLRLAVFEHGSDEEPTAAGFSADRRRYGSSLLTILRPCVKEQS